MANKLRPGIPDNFKLNVAPVTDLGDYLDEPAPSPVAAKRVGEGNATPNPSTTSTRPRTVVGEPQVTLVHSVPVVANTDATKTHEALNEPKGSVLQSSPITESVEAPPRRRRTRPSREISMSCEVLRTFDELLELIRSGSGQRDTRANEFIHALLLLVHEVKDELNPHTLPKRGRWGTPTARAYPLEIKNAILQALRRKHLDVK